MIAAVCCTAVSTCRSDEMPLLMKANARRSRSFDSGNTRMPRMPTTTWSPALISRSLRQKRLAISDHDQRIHALILAPEANHRCAATSVR